MNPLDLFNQVKELIETKDFEAACGKSRTAWRILLSSSAVDFWF